MIYSEEIFRMQNLSEDTILDVLNASLAEVSEDSRVSAKVIIHKSHGGVSLVEQDTIEN